MIDTAKYSSMEVTPPTVGRIVHVFEVASGEFQKHNYKYEGPWEMVGPFAAIVTAVFDVDKLIIGVTAFFPRGGTRASEVRHESTREAPYMSYWIWPPR